MLMWMSLRGWFWSWDVKTLFWLCHFLSLRWKMLCFHVYIRTACFSWTWHCAVARAQVQLSVLIYECFGLTKYASLTLCRSLLIFSHFFAHAIDFAKIMMNLKGMPYQ